MEWRVMKCLLVAEYPLHLLVAGVEVGVHAGLHESARLGKRENTPAGCSKRPFSKAAASEEARRTLRYVEPLSDARTMLAGFFSILRERSGVTGLMPGCPFV